VRYLVFRSLEGSFHALPRSRRSRRRGNVAPRKARPTTRGRCGNLFGTNQLEGNCHAQIVSDIATLQQYLQGVVMRADHHANNVDEISLTIAGAIALAHGRGSRCRTYAGSMANVMRVRINGQQYTLAYNHTTGEIEARRELTGRVLRSFTMRTRPRGQGLFRLTVNFPY